MNLVVSHWSANAVVLAACAAVAAAHLAGTRAAAAETRRQRQRRRAGAAAEAAAFYCGLLAVVLALVSPVGYWAQKYIWVRSVQDLLLAVAAPALIVLGAPWLVLARGIPRGLSRHRAGELAPDLTPPARPPTAPDADTGAGSRVWLSLPLAVTAAFNAAWWAWHVPALYDAALRYPVVYAAEVSVYLGLGVAFWLQLAGSRPFTPRFTPLRRVTLVVGTLTSSTVLAMVLIFTSRLLYPAYLGAGHHVLGVVADQQIGGAVLWAASLPPFVIMTVALILRWLNEEESGALTAGFDRLLRPPPSAWPSRPGHR
jgi:putative membrane protein